MIKGKKNAFLNFHFTEYSIVLALQPDIRLALHQTDSRTDLKGNCGLKMSSTASQFMTLKIAERAACLPREYFSVSFK